MLYFRNNVIEYWWRWSHRIFSVPGRPPFVDTFFKHQIQHLQKTSFTDIDGRIYEPSPAVNSIKWKLRHFFSITNFRNYFWCMTDSPTGVSLTSHHPTQEVLSQPIGCWPSQQGLFVIIASSNYSLAVI